MTEDARTKKAGVTRDNAYRDLALTLHKVMRPILALTKGELFGPGKVPGGPPERLEVMFPYAPAQMHDLIRNLQVANKQLEIGLICLIDHLVKTERLDLVTYLEDCAKKAEEIQSLLNRGLLSQGLAGSHSGAIIKLDG